MRPGDHVGEYVLRERMGEGGFGEVWMAENADLPGRAVAIKIAKDPSYVSALKQEAELLHRLDHPNIVRLLTIHASADPPYLVLEHVRGESLRQRIDRLGRLDVEAAVSLVLEVLAGLQAAHEAGLVHRDVKPSNVLIGPDGRPKLADFGLGRAVRSSAGSVQVSAQGTIASVVGTLDYMSPEQRRGEAGDARSDLYACGVLLYEAIAGTARPVKLPVKGAPSALSKAIERALAVAPGERFPSASEMAAALRSSVLLPEVPAAPREACVAVPSAFRSQPMPTSLAKPILVVLMAVIGLGFLGFLKSGDPAKPAPVVTTPLPLSPAVPAEADPVEDVARPATLCLLPERMRHRGTVEAIAFAPDGKTLVTGSSDGMVRLWGVPEGEPTRCFDLRAEVLSVAMSRDGRKVAAGGPRGKTRVWLVEGHGDGVDLDTKEGDVLAIAFTDDDRSLVTVDGGGSIRRWDLERRAIVSRVETGGAPTSCAMAMDGTTFVAQSGVVVGTRTVASGKATWETEGDTEWSWVSISEQGRWVALEAPAARPQIEVRVWSTVENRILCHIRTDGGPVTGMALSEASGLVAVAQRASAVRIWSVPAARTSSTPASVVPVSRLAFSPDGSMLALAGGNRAYMSFVHHGPSPDWFEPSEGSRGGIPRLDASLRPAESCVAGEVAVLVVRVRNEGEGAASQLWARLETDDPRIGGACAFGVVPRAATFTRSIVFRIPADRAAGPLVGRVRFFDADGYAPTALDVRLEVGATR